MVGWVENVNASGFEACVSTSGPIRPSREVTVQWLTYDVVPSQGREGIEDIPLWTTGTECVTLDLSGHVSSGGVLRIGSSFCGICHTFHFMSRQVTSREFMTNHVTSRHFTSSRLVISLPLFLSHSPSCHVTSLNFMITWVHFVTVFLFNSPYCQSAYLHPSRILSS